MFHIASREKPRPDLRALQARDRRRQHGFTIGSANLTRRSWTFDSEINVACIDERLRRGGHQSARQLRVDLLAEHLQLLPVETPLIDDPRDAFRIVKDVARRKAQMDEEHICSAST